ncbi:MAG: hypothetical protein FJ271_04435 [Planctomycetes bacterium]|nr:hypothetical protein [Planctomycetota bacterium]
MDCRKTVLIGCVGGGVLAACWIIVAESSPAGEEQVQPTVQQLEMVSFRRVPGDAAKGAVLDKGDPASWYSGSVGAPTIHFDGKVYRMWFVGDEPTKDLGVPYGIYQRIGLAISTDGRRWKVGNGGKPVLDLGPRGSADAKGLCHPYVLKVADRYWMWYGAIDGTQARDLGLDPAHVRVERICFATSTDGVHWQRQNRGKPVLDIGPKGTIDSIQATGMHVLKIKDQFIMWYGAYNGRHTIGIASSPDGIRWQRLNNGKPLAGLVGGQQGQCGVSVYHDGRRYLMLYGADKGGAWNTYAAVSDDGLNFKKLRGDRSVLGPTPALHFDSAGIGRNHCVHPTQFLVSDRKVRVWYVGEDGSPPHGQRIGLMEAVLP